MAKSGKSAVPSFDSNDWQAKSDMRTLIDAHKIKSDKKRHNAAKRHARAEIEAHANVAGETPNQQ